MHHTLNINRQLIAFDRPLVMGILNLTPDSFYDGGRYDNVSKVLHRVEQMLSEGADIIDIGACSTRPGSESVDENTEWQRLEKNIIQIVNHFPQAILSVDTFRSSVAQKAISLGVAIINDISGGAADNQMFPILSQLRVPYVLTHIQGTPNTMQIAPQYDGCVTDSVLKDLSAQIDILHQSGVGDIIVDPGFGFGKSLVDNYTLLASLHKFKALNCPILVGISRKSMIYKLLDTTPEEAINGTTVLNTIALLAGADILRVHDVRQCVEAIKIVQTLQSTMPK